MLLEPLHPAAGVLAKTRFHILVLPERPQHESYAFGIGTREQQYPVADHAVAQQRRGVVDEHQVEPIAWNLAAERPGQSPDRVLDRRRRRDTFVVEQHRDVDVALAARGAACPASVQPGETNRGVAAQGVCEAVAEASSVVVAGGQIHVISLGCLVGPRGWGKPRISLARSGRKGDRAVIGIGASAAPRGCSRPRCRIVAAEPPVFSHVPLAQQSANNTISRATYLRNISRILMILRV